MENVRGVAARPGPRLVPRAWEGRLAGEAALALALIGLGLGAFLVRLLPMLWSGGLRGMVGYDDGVYMGTALAAVRGSIVYRDFYMLHPPGIVYVLSPFAFLSYVVSDAAAFTAARLGFMALGALNTILVGALGFRLASRNAALAAAALYAVWYVPAKIERTTWLIAPQNTLLLLALLVLALAPVDERGEQRITARRAAVVGVLVGFCGVIQIWGIVPAAVILIWLALRTRRQAGGWVRPTVAYATAGLATVAITFLPFLLVAGEKMIRIVIFDQLGRTVGASPLGSRVEAIEGIPSLVVHRLGGVRLSYGVLGVVGIGVVALAVRRPQVRLCVALLCAQAGLLLVSPSFYVHYAGWIAPVAALSIGAAVAALADATPRIRVRTIAALYVAGLTALLIFTMVPGRFYKVPSTGLPNARLAEAIAGARCPTADYPTLLIESGALRTILDHGCPLYVSPTGVSYDTDPNLRGRARIRQNQVEYQSIMAAYYGGSDAAMFIRVPQSRGLTDATVATIRQHLPVQVDVGRIRIFLPTR